MNVIQRYIGGRLAEYTINGVPQAIRMGDKIAAIATPIALALGSGCIDPETKQLKKDSGCQKMKERLNAGMSMSEAMKLRWQGK